MKLKKNKWIYIVLALVGLEVVSRLLYPYWFGKRDEELAFPKFKRSRYYCDGYHKNVEGQKLALQCWDNGVGKLVTKNKKIWVLGGSTSTEHECDITDGIWVRQIFSKEYGKSVKNYSEENMTSDMQIKSMMNNLESDTPNIIIFSMIGTPELQFYGDSRDRNYEKLINEKKVNVQPNRNHVSQTTMFLIKLNKTVEKYYYTYRLILAPFLKLQGSLVDFLEFLKREGEMAFEKTPWDKAMILESKFAPVRYMLSPESLKYAVENYKINLEDISKVAHDKNIEIVCALHPYSRNYHSSVYPYLGEDFVHWLDVFYSEAKSACEKYGFKIIDMKECFEDQEKKDQK